MEEKKAEEIIRDAITKGKRIMSATTLSNAGIKRYCGGKAEEITEIVGEMADAYDAKGGTIGWDYDEDGREDVRKLLSGKYLGDGSKIWSDGVLFVHYDGKQGTINLGSVGVIE